MRGRPLPRPTATHSLAAPIPPHNNPLSRGDPPSHNHPTYRVVAASLVGAPCSQRPAAKHGLWPSGPAVHTAVR